MTPIPAGWKLVEALRESLLWTASSLAAVGKEQDVITLEGRKRTIGEILDEANAALDAPSPASVAPGDAQDELTRDRIEEIAHEVYKVERFTKDDEVWHNMYWLTSFAKAIEKELRRPAPAAGDARDLPLAQKYEDACILANANAQDAARYRSHRAALTSVNTAWLDNVTAALEAMGLDPDDADALPTAAQVDAAFDAALAAQVPQQGEA